MIHPCTRSEVADVVLALSKVLTDEQLLHVCETDGENPDVYTVAALDDEGFVNSGLVGYAPDSGEIYFACHNPVTETRDHLEGVPEDESKCWWPAGSQEVFLWHLVGRVRVMAAKWHRIMREQIALDTETKTPTLTSMPTGDHLPYPPCPCCCHQPATYQPATFGPLPIVHGLRTYLAAHAPARPDSHYVAMKRSLVERAGQEPYEAWCDHSAAEKQAIWAVEYADALIDRLNTPRP